MILLRVFFVVLLFLYLNMSTSAYGADFLSQLHPYISVGGAYSDNINLTAENKKGDFFTTITPGLKFSNMDAKSGVDMDASAGVVLYNQYSNLNYISANANLNAKYMTTEHFNFYLKDSFIRSDNPREQELFTTTADNKFMTATQIVRAVYWRNALEPTVEYQFGPENRVGINYRNNNYQTESAIAQNSIENYVNPFISYWFDKQNGIYLEYGYTNGDFEAYPDLTGHRVNARYINRFTPNSSAFVEYTFSRRDFASPGVDYDINEGDVGIIYNFTPALTGSAQVGYYLMTPKTGSNIDGITFKGELINKDPQTTYRMSIQGGYTEDYFTSQNLGFLKYYRATGSITHFLEKRISIGFLGSVELVDYILDRNDTIWSVSGTASYQALKWLTFSIQILHTENKSSIDLYDYTENRGMIMVTATY